MKTATPVQQCGRLIAVTLAAAILLSPVAMLVAGVEGLQGLAVSAGLCLVPGLLTVWFATSASDPMVKVWLTVGGMIVRMMIVLMVALVFYVLLPEWGLKQFYIWLIVFYNVLLLAETWLLLPRGDNAT